MKIKIYSVAFTIFLMGCFFIVHGFAAQIELSLDELKLTREETAWLKSTKSIRIGGPRAFQPFHYFDDQGQLKGISADYIFAIMSKLGIKLEVQKNLPWTEVLDKAKSGKIDLIPCAAKTVDREGYLNFSTPYLSFPLVILTSKDAPYIGGIEDLHGKKLAVIQKNAVYSWLKRDKIKFEPYYVESPLKKLEAISLGRVDAVIENLAAASYSIQKYGLTNVKIAAPTPYGNYNLHMAVSKDLPELLGIINKVLHSITPEQHMQTRSKWLSVRYEHGINKVDILKWVLAISVFSLTVIGIILFWNRRFQKAEKALKESERKLSTLMDNLPGIAYQCLNDVNWTMLYISNGCYELTGYEPFELVKNQTLSYGDLIVEDDRQYVEDEIQIAINGKRAFAIEYRIRDKNQNIKWLWEKGRGIFNKEKKLSSLEGFITDITERKQAEKEKINAQQIAGEQKKLALVGQIAGKMAHDFNNILAVIMGNAQLSLLDCKEAKTIKTLELIFNQTIRGKNLTKNLVVFAKDQEPKQEFFRLGEKIDLVCDLLKKDLQGIELVKEDKAGIPDLLADPGMIEHAFVNLLQNSIHAVSLVEHPRIITRIYSLDDNICIEIEDNGCGIPKEYLDNIFEPSFTLKGSKDMTGSYGREIKGTGYGMANVKKYIDQHKGSISIESEIGSGTKFTISLPVIKKELTSQEKAEIQKENTYFDKYILLVEDEPAISGVQYRILSQEPCNHKVDIAHDGQVAMDLFKRNEYDLISLDYVLPGGINGMDVYDYIRKTNQAIPILFISGNIEFLESIKRLKQKDDNIDHLSKPCQNKDYVKSINELFERNYV
jgi:two-component system, cell cycle sensor histidine kinase and response regulator CckA